MKIILTAFISLFSLSAFPHDPEELLANFQKTYGPDLEVRHQLFLSEYHMRRFEDYKNLYEKNVRLSNQIARAHEDLSTQWNLTQMNGYEDKYQLGLLATIKAQGEYLEDSLEGSYRTLKTLEDSYSLACSPKTVSWMEDTFRPLKVYTIPHMSFTGDGGAGDIHANYRFGYYYNLNDNSNGGMNASSNLNAQEEGGGSYKAALQTLGLIGGSAAGAILCGPTCAQVGGFVGGLIGAYIGNVAGGMIEAGKEISDYTKTIDKMKKTFEAINETFRVSHEKVDQTHVQMIYSTCSDIFKAENSSYFQEAASKSQALLNSVKMENHRINNEWEQVKAYQAEKFNQNLHFLSLISSNYDFNLENAHSENFEILSKEIRTSLSEFKKNEYDPSMEKPLDNDYSTQEALVNLDIAGDAFYNSQKFPLNKWKIMSDEIRSRLGSAL